MRSPWDPPRSRQRASPSAPNDQDEPPLFDLIQEGLGKIGDAARRQGHASDLGTFCRMRRGEVLDESDTGRLREESSLNESSQDLMFSKKSVSATLGSWGVKA